jgi:hypothetical protein
MKPGDLSLSVQDFFAVLLPGALAMWLISHYVPPDVAAIMLPGKLEVDQPGTWTVFVLGSYLLGNFVFMAGSRLDPSYDRWRRRTKPTSADSAYLAANRIRAELTPGLVGPDFTMFKWAKSYVQVRSPAAGVEIERFEATSKFFRGMVVMSIALFAHFLLARSVGLAVIMIVLGALSYERFRDQRWKATELSYGTAVILHATEKRTAPTEKKDNPEDG